MPEENVFIDFEIIKESEPKIISRELDKILFLGKRIYVWSKHVPPLVMRKQCESIEIETSKEEKELHEKIFTMRFEGKSYQEISNETGLPTNSLYWYIQNKPGKIWTLDDWIADYYEKDSSFYSKVDCIIDVDERFVARFKSRGTPAYLTLPLKGMNSNMNLRRQKDE